MWGRYVKDESKLISFCVLIGLDFGEFGFLGFVEIGKIVELENLVFCNVLVSFLVIWNREKCIILLLFMR